MYITTFFHYTDHEEESSDPPSAYSSSGMYGSRHVLDYIFIRCMGSQSVCMYMFLHLLLIDCSDKTKDWYSY